MNELELFMTISLADWVIVGLFVITWWMITKLNKKVNDAVYTDQDCEGGEK